MSGLTRTRGNTASRCFAVLAAIGGEYMGNNAGLQQKITALDNDGNRKAISNGAFYRLVEQAKERGLISVDQTSHTRKTKTATRSAKARKATS